MRFDAKKFVNTIAILAILSTLFLGVSAITTTDAVPEGPVALSDYIQRCYDADNPGFADMPGGISSLESTLDAVELLTTETDPLGWSNGLRESLARIAERYSEMQSPYQYGFVHPSSDEFSPDPKTTALVLETLSLMNRLDTVSLTGVCRYLEKSGEGISKYGLDLTRWATEGDFEWKYWLLRSAYAIDGTVLEDGTVIKSLKKLGVTQLSRDFVLSPDTNIADFDLPEPYLVWDKELLSPNAIYGGGFESESYTRKLALVDSYRMMLEDEVDSPTLLGLLFDTDKLANEVLSYYNEDLLMFQDAEGRLSLRATTDALEILDTVGKIERAFEGDWAAYKYADSITFWENGVSEWEELARTDSGSLVDRKVLSDTSRVLERVDDTKVTYTPVFGEDSTGISRWIENRRTPGRLLLTDTFWEYYRPTDTNEPSNVVLNLELLPIGILILIGVAFSFASDVKTLKMLSVFCIIFFVFQVVFMDTSLFDQMSSFVGSIIPQYSRPMADMTAFGTAYLDLTYPEGNSTVQAPEEESIVPELSSPFTASWAPMISSFIPNLQLFPSFPYFQTSIVPATATFALDGNVFSAVSVLDLSKGLKTSDFSNIIALDGSTVRLSSDAVAACRDFNFGQLSSIIGIIV